MPKYLKQTLKNAQTLKLNSFKIRPIIINFSSLSHNNNKIILKKIKVNKFFIPLYNLAAYNFVNR